MKSTVVLIRPHDTALLRFTTRFPGHLNKGIAFFKIRVISAECWKYALYTATNSNCRSKKHHISAIIMNDGTPFITTPPEYLWDSKFSASYVHGGITY